MKFYALVITLNYENNTTFMLRIERIKELRAELNQFTDPSEIFIKSIKQKCENEGIDPHIVICSDEHFEVICKTGNPNEFKL